MKQDCACSLNCGLCGFEQDEKTRKERRKKESKKEGPKERERCRVTIIILTLKAHVNFFKEEPTITHTQKTPQKNNSK